MRISPVERLQVTRDLTDTRADTRLCYICTPVLVDQDFDEDTRSGDNMTEGNGLGQVAADWKIYALRVHFRNVDTMLMNFGHVPPGVELGDALINFGSRDLPAVEQSMESENSYLLIDGDTFHILSVLPSGLGQIEEWAADARHFTPIFRAQGY